MSGNYITGEDGRLYYQDESGAPPFPVRDRDEHQRQLSADSHKGFFEDPKRKLRRIESVEARFNQLAMDRADPGFHPDVKRISDETFMSMRSDPAFLPLGGYAHKLQRPDGRWIRPILKGEVGIIGATIYVLEEGEGRVFSVGEQLVGKEVGNAEVSGTSE